MRGKNENGQQKARVCFSDTGLKMSSNLLSFLLSCDLSFFRPFREAARKSVRWISVNPSPFSGQASRLRFRSTHTYRYVRWFPCQIHRSHVLLAGNVRMNPRYNHRPSRDNVQRYCGWWSCIYAVWLFCFRIRNRSLLTELSLPIQ